LDSERGKAARSSDVTTFDIIVESMLGGSASLDAERYSRALTENFDTIPWHLIYTMFAVPEWVPFPNRSRAMQSRSSGRYCSGRAGPGVDQSR
jgi:hypothetical protein